MRVLFTNTGPWGTGSATVVDAVSTEMMRQGHQVKIFFPDCHFESMDMEKYYGNRDVYHIWEFPIRKRGVELYTFPLIITDPHPRNYRHAWTFRDMSEEQLRLYLQEFKRRIKRIIQSFKPHIIECQHIWAMDHVMMELGYPFISAAHHSDQMGFRYDPRMREYALRASQSASYIFAISDMVRQEAFSLTRATETFEAARSFIMLRENRLCIGTVSGRALGSGTSAESAGMTFGELAQLAMDLRADSAYALDGGGSSSIVVRTGDDVRVLNTPTGGSDVARGEERFINTYWLFFERDG